jgi:putative transposase
MIKELRREYPVRILCRVPGVSSNGFHAWLVRRELAADGFPVSLGTVKSVRRELGLRCVQRKRQFRAQTTDSGHQLPVAPNLLGQDFKVERPDEVWTADITYVATAEGWLYVAAIKDLFAGEIVGRAFGQRMTTESVVRALQQAVAARRPAEGLIHHSDRGSQYCSHGYQALLSGRGMRASMSRRGNCYDNAPVESFFGILKTELVYTGTTARARRPRARSGSTSTCSITGSGGKPAWSTCHRLLTHNGSRGSKERRERHTWRPFLTTHLSF